MLHPAAHIQPQTVQPPHQMPHSTPQYQQLLQAGTMSTFPSGGQGSPAVLPPQYTSPPQAVQPPHPELPPSYHYRHLLRTDQRTMPASGEDAFRAYSGERQLMSSTALPPQAQQPPYREPHSSSYYQDSLRAGHTSAFSSGGGIMRAILEGRLPPPAAQLPQAQQPYHGNAGSSSHYQHQLHAGQTSTVTNEREGSQQLPDGKQLLSPTALPPQTQRPPQEDPHSTSHYQQPQQAGTTSTRPNGGEASLSALEGQPLPPAALPPQEREPPTGEPQSSSHYQKLQQAGTAGTFAGGSDALNPSSSSEVRGQLQSPKALPPQAQQPQPPHGKSYSSSHYQTLLQTGTTDTFSSGGEGSSAGEGRQPLPATALPAQALQPSHSTDPYQKLQQAGATTTFPWGNASHPSVEGRHRLPYTAFPQQAQQPPHGEPHSSSHYQHQLRADQIGTYPSGGETSHLSGFPRPSQHHPWPNAEREQRQVMWPAVSLEARDPSSHGPAPPQALGPSIVPPLRGNLRTAEGGVSNPTAVSWASDVRSVQGLNEHGPYPGNSASFPPRVAQSGEGADQLFEDGFLQAQQPGVFPGAQLSSDQMHSSQLSSGSNQKRPLEELDAGSSHDMSVSPKRQKTQIYLAIELVNDKFASGDTAEPQATTTSENPGTSDISYSMQLSSNISASQVQTDAAQADDAEITSSSSEPPTGQACPSYSEAFIAHPFYRLPKLSPEIKVRQFSAEKAFSRGNLISQASAVLGWIRSLLVKEELSERDVNELIAATERAVCHLFYFHQSPIIKLGAAQAAMVLARRYLMLDAVVSVMQVVGPAMVAHQWWPELAAALPTTLHFGYTHSPYRRTKALEELATRLSTAVELLKKCIRPSPQETVELKRELFCRKSSPQCFMGLQWEAWRLDDGI